VDVLIWRYLVKRPLENVVLERPLLLMGYAAVKVEIGLQVEMSTERDAGIAEKGLGQGLALRPHRGCLPGSEAAGKREGYDPEGADEQDDDSFLAMRRLVQD